ncbi:hypothetical protein PN498_01085 [Oscillatoria sp. CS-180]|uniref:hypothetical protein n=1 Tax=Oscillatoria sp. CS-180 TaxID=3021720 RepID=UPI002330C777|nr:hypothetical protein [Oscillatoria sp. CS-180]MDB9524567.1 hypothetical protein [Oscillatoria sp. CS-180]
MKMHGISESKFQTEVKPIMQKVFRGNSEWDPVFRPEMNLRRIIYPLRPYVGDESFEHLLHSIQVAASHVQDRGCFFSEIHDYPREFNHAYLTFPELVKGFKSPKKEGSKSFWEIDMEFSNYFMLYSEKGNWGLISSFEHFGLLGGMKEFMGIIQTQLPTIENQTYEFLRDFRGDPTETKSISKTRPIIEGMLKHIYDASKAEQLLRKTGWD